MGINRGLGRVQGYELRVLVFLVSESFNGLNRFNRFNRV